MGQKELAEWAVNNGHTRFEQIPAEYRIEAALSYLFQYGELGEALRLIESDLINYARRGDATAFGHLIFQYSERYIRNDVQERIDTLVSEQEWAGDFELGI